MIEPAGEPSLLDRVEQYLQQHRVTATRFGKIVVKSPSLVARMRSGKTLRRQTIERIEAFISSPLHAVSTHKPMTQAQYKAKRYRLAVTQQVRADIMDRERRLTDPCEQAATLLRSRGWKVFRAWVHEAGATGWYVGTARKTDDEMMEFARRCGWRE